MTRAPIPRGPAPTQNQVPKPAAPAARAPAASDASEVVERLGKAREICDRMLKETSRLSGERDAANRRREELAAKCKADFDCDRADISALVAGMRDALEKSAEGAEAVLGLGVPAPG